MASLPQPWHVHERQMRGHPVELQVPQRFGAHDGRLPIGEEECQQGLQNMRLPPQLPPIPTHMPLGRPLYSSQGQYPQQFLRDEDMRPQRAV
ncbi:g8194 [Coccomyxa viridis]|uniref:G8194 protein n=1 Tax=Coccomyxa viridis TaxID=1274662 RepID=A0ABP1G6A2_9CHLO